MGMRWYISIMLSIGWAFAESFEIHRSQSWVGSLQFVQVNQGDRVTEMAERYSVGLDALAAANPHVPLQHLKAGTQLMLPKMCILPSVRQGIVINIPEKRLYYFQSPEVVHIFPVAVGRVHHDSRLGQFVISEKRYQPQWNVPASILKEEHQKGNKIPAVFPTGPENPLGSHAMRLSGGSILIHGTNFPPGVGKRSTTGCFSMFPNDIAALYEMVPMGTPVTVINQPIKVAKTPEGWLIESHPTSAQTSNHGIRPPTETEIASNVSWVQTQYAIGQTLALYDLFSHNMGVPLPIGSYDHVASVSVPRSAPRR